MLDNVVKQFSTRYIFHHHKNICRRGNNLVQFDDMRMPEQFQVLNFSPDLANHIQALDFLSIQNLHSHFMIGNLMESN